MSVVREFMDAPVVKYADLKVTGWSTAQEVEFIEGLSRSVRIDKTGHTLRGPELLRMYADAIRQRKVWNSIDRRVIAATLARLGA